MDGKGLGRNDFNTMTGPMDLLVMAGMIDRKFFSKVMPLIKMNQVRRIYVVRRSPISGEKLRCFSPFGVFRANLLLGELYRILAGIYVLVRYRPQVVVGIGLILHGIYANILGTIFRKKRILLLKGKNDLGLTYPRRRGLQRLLLKVAGFSDFIGTRGERSRAWLIGKGFKEERVFIPHNLFDFEAFAPESASVKKYDMIYVGLLRDYKRVDLLIDVVHGLVKEDGLQDAKLAIVGAGGLRNCLEKKSAGLGLKANIDFLPTGDAHHVCRLLNQSRVFVMTSQGEGLPMAAVEALSCGLPVVIFDDADVGDVVCHGRNGFLVAPEDLDGFVNAVKSLLKDKKLYQRLSQKALGIREQRGHDYSLESISATWASVLKACAEQGRGV